MSTFPETFNKKLMIQTKSSKYQRHRNNELFLCFQFLMHKVKEIAFLNLSLMSKVKGLLLDLQYIF